MNRLRRGVLYPNFPLFWSGSLPTENGKNAHASLPPVTSLAKRSLETTLVARFPERAGGHEGHH
jgi:hypothetical protein